MRFIEPASYLPEETVTHILSSLFEKAEKMSENFPADLRNLSNADREKWFEVGKVAGGEILKIKPEMLPPPTSVKGPPVFLAKEDNEEYDTYLPDFDDLSEEDQKKCYVEEEIGGIKVLKFRSEMLPLLGYAKGPTVFLSKDEKEKDKYLLDVDELSEEDVKKYYNEEIINGEKVLKLRREMLPPFKEEEGPAIFHAKEGTYDKPEPWVLPDAPALAFDEDF